MLNIKVFTSVSSLLNQIQDAYIFTPLNILEVRDLKEKIHFILICTLRSSAKILLHNSATEKMISLAIVNLVTESPSDYLIQQ